MRSADGLRVLLVGGDADAAAQIHTAVGAHFGQVRFFHLASLSQADPREASAIDVVLINQGRDNRPEPDVEAIRSSLGDAVAIVLADAARLDWAAAALRAGSDACVVKVGDYLSILPLVIDKSLAARRQMVRHEHTERELDRAMVELYDRAQLLEHTMRLFERQAATDAVTGLANRRHLDEALARSFAEAVRYKTELSCMMLDLDGFKRFNDTYGHPEGDRLLGVVGKAIKACCRGSDLVARYGGDEFAVVMPRTAAPGAGVLAQRVHGRLEDELDGVMPPGHGVTVSIGVASLLHEGSDDPQRLLRRADEALYQAKGAGKARVRVHAQGEA